MSKWSYTVKSEDAGRSIKELLRRNFSFSSRMMTRFKQNDCIRLNDERVRLSVLPKPGDTISVALPDERSYFPPEDIPITPIFEDADLLIINKAAGYVVHPTNGYPSHTIANGMAQYLITTGQDFKIRFVNRLDMDTSGLLIIAKNAHCQDKLVHQMKENKVTKKYTAVTYGVIKDDFGTINAPIGKPDPERAQRGVVADGYPSITHYKVLKRFEKGFTLVELLLETGRTHQIRVHLSHIGHPVVGDLFYGGENTLIERQALHAGFLSFYHPITAEFTEALAEIPEDMRTLVEKIT